MGDIDDPAITVFYFNLPGAFIGCLEVADGGGRPIPYRHFIATPLLPCSELDSKVQKITGNDRLLTPHSDLEHAIHAFSHFVWLWTHGDLFLCDLQGKTLCPLLRPFPSSISESIPTC